MQHDRLIFSNSRVCKQNSLRQNIIIKLELISVDRLEGHGGREMSLTSSEGHDLSHQPMFGFRVCDNQSDISWARQQFMRGNEPEFRQTATIGRYQRLQTVCFSAVYDSRITI